ncbi:MAG: CpaD family pilus assembly lipoprotein [Azospirillaceae bacterium]
MTRPESRRRGAGARGPVLGLALAAAALSLGACVSENSSQTTRAPNAFQVETTRLTHEVRFAPEEVRLAPSETRALADFVRSVGAAPGDRVVVSGAGPLSAARQRLVAEELAAYGLTNVELVPGGRAGPGVQVTVERLAYVPNSCTRLGTIGVPAGTHLLPHGCANDLNLARMVEDRRDLVRGRDLGPAEAGPSILALERYRANDIKPLDVDKASEQ